MRTEQPKTIYLKDYQKPGFNLEKTNLTFDLFEEETIVTAESYYKMDASTQKLSLNGKSLELISVDLNGKPLNEDEYTASPDLLELHNVPPEFNLKVVTKLKPQENKSLEGVYKPNGKFCTQCEPQGFRRITFFPDRPDVMTIYTTRIIADATKYPVLLSNGNKIDSGKLENNRHFATWYDPWRKPCYLFALVAGNLKSVDDKWVTESGREVKLQLFVEPQDLDKTEFAMQALKDSMKWDEQVYGLEYDLDIFMIVAVSDFNAGAMENKGLNIFNSRYVLANPQAATDSDFENIQGVIGHEYFHNWSGNRVTCRDWFQLSLKEGLTVFRDQEFSADMTSHALKRISDVNRLRTSQFPEDSSPMAHPVRPESYIEINNFYTPTVYEKGAEVIRMMYTLIGKETFRKGTDLYFQRHDGDAVTIDDFVKAMEEASGLDLNHFKLWYSQSGTPHVQARGNWDESKNVYHLTIKQTIPNTPGQTNKKMQYIPMKVGLLADDGTPIAFKIRESVNDNDPTNQVVVIDKEEQTFSFENVPCQPIHSLFRDFSAPIYLDADYTPLQLQFLMTHEPNGFNRYEAAQQLGIQIIQKIILSLEHGDKPIVDPGYLEAISSCINDATLDPKFKAMMIEPPTRNHMLNLLKTPDVERLYQATEILSNSLASTFKSELLSMYHNHQDDTWQFTVDAVGRRALKNLCLRWLMRLETDDIYDLCIKQLNESDNMTDSIAAFQSIANSNCPQREAEISKFHEKWKHDPLVIDKWFAVQAASTRDNVMEEAEKLIAHPDFDFLNPNRAFSVFRSFANPNPKGFHHSSGKGYKLIADFVLKIDPHNSSVAARLVGSIIRWRNYADKHSQKMKVQLERIIGTPHLSKDVYEIVSKSLQ